MSVRESGSEYFKSLLHCTTTYLLIHISRTIKTFYVTCRNYIHCTNINTQLVLDNYLDLIEYCKLSNLIMSLL